MRRLPRSRDAARRGRGRSRVDQRPGPCADFRDEEGIRFDETTAFVLDVASDGAPKPRTHLRAGEKVAGLGRPERPAGKEPAVGVVEARGHELLERHGSIGIDPATEAGSKGHTFERSQPSINTWHLERPSDPPLFQGGVPGTEWRAGRVSTVRREAVKAISRTIGMVSTEDAPFDRHPTCPQGTPRPEPLARPTPPARGEDQNPATNPVVSWPRRAIASGRYPGRAPQWR